MKAGRFSEILALRGRIVLFSPSALLSVQFEQFAERNHAQVICTRGFADPHVPLGAWHRLHASREYGLLSCDQRVYPGKAIPATDVAWIGDTGDAMHTPHLWRMFDAAMSCATAGDANGNAVRKWLLGETPNG